MAFLLAAFALFLNLAFSWATATSNEAEADGSKKAEQQQEEDALAQAACNALTEAVGKQSVLSVEPTSDCNSLDRQVGATVVEGTSLDSLVAAYEEIVDETSPSVKNSKYGLGLKMIWVVNGVSITVNEDIKPWGTSARLRSGLVMASAAASQGAQAVEVSQLGIYVSWGQGGVGSLSVQRPGVEQDADVVAISYNQEVVAGATEVSLQMGEGVSGPEKADLEHWVGVAQDAGIASVQVQAVGTGTYLVATLPTGAGVDELRGSGPGLLKQLDQCSATDQVSVVAPGKERGDDKSVVYLCRGGRLVASAEPGDGFPAHQPELAAELLEQARR